MGIKERAAATFKKDSERQASEHAEQQAKNDARNREELIKRFVQIFNVYPEKATAETITHESMEFKKAEHGYQALSYRPDFGYSDCKCPGSARPFGNLNEFGRILSAEKQPHGCYCPEKPAASTEEGVQQVPETTEQRLIRALREWVFENTYQG